MTKTIPMKYTPRELEMRLETQSTIDWLKSLQVRLRKIANQDCQEIANTVDARARNIAKVLE